LDAIAETLTAATWCVGAVLSGAEQARVMVESATNLEEFERDDT
jgi:hypothetical protein